MFILCIKKIPHESLNTIKIRNTEQIKRVDSVYTHPLYYNVDNDSQYFFHVGNQVCMHR